MVRTAEVHPLIDVERQKIARRYRSDNRKVGILSLVVAAIFLLILLQFDISREFVEFSSQYVASRILLILIYFSALYIVYSLLTLPFAYVEGYSIEHKYGFSTQNRRDWFLDWLKSLVVTYVIGLIVFELIYLIMPVAPTLWWLWLSLIMVGFSVVLANLFPVVILPLFYKSTPLDDDELKERITGLCDKAHIRIRGIFSINLSSKTTKANAAVTGLGNTKRILVGDTLIAKYTTGETISALAHEIVHYREHHTWWLVLWQSMITIIMFYLFHRIQPFVYSWFGFEQAADIAAFPLFALVFAVLSYLFRPLSSALSRYYERKADKGALALTADPDAFINLIAKLCNEQLSIAYPNPLVEWYKYSHPSPGRRIAFAGNWEPH
jgi:STE24 endopeptidase